MADPAGLTIYLEEIRRSDGKQKALERQIADLLKEIPLADYILSLPGMGPGNCGHSWGNWETRSTSRTHDKSSSTQATIQRRTMPDREAFCAVILKLTWMIFAPMRDRRPFIEKHEPLSGKSIKKNKVVVEGGLS